MRTANRTRSIYRAISFALTRLRLLSSRISGCKRSPILLLALAAGLAQAVTFDYESGTAGWGSNTVTQTIGSDVLRAVSTGDTLDNAANTGGVVVAGIESLFSFGGYLGATQVVFSLQSGKSFDLTSISFKENNGDAQTLTLTSSKGTATQALAPLGSATLSNPANMQGITSFTITSTVPFLIAIDNVVLQNIGLPGAPTGASATAGNASATVSFTAPASDGGSAITSYTATSSPGGLTGSCAGPAACVITVSGLTNGTAYTFTVTATNGAGTGPASTASNSVTPKASQTITFANPGAQNFGTSPTLTATASSGLTVSFTSSTTGVCTITAGGTLTFVTTGTCTINADQAGNASYLAAPTVTQSFGVNAVVPGAPTGASATAGNASATVSFTAPASNGGATITSYSVSCASSDGGTPGSNSGAGSPVTVAALTNGKTYTCTVTATNSAGTGPASAASNSVIPSIKSYTGPLPGGGGTATAVVTGGGAGCGFSSSAFIPVSGDPASPPVPPPAGYTFANGLFHFGLNGCTSGATVTVTITYPSALAANTVYWKFGPTPTPSLDPVRDPTPGATPHWYQLAATVSGNTVTFSITDGQLGDDDLAANGTIVDQGGPGVPGPGLGGAAAIPTLSEWALLLLSGLLGWFGLRAAGRRAA